MDKKRFVAEVQKELSSVGKIHHWLVVKDTVTGKEAHIYFDCVGEVVSRMAAWFNTALKPQTQLAVVQNFIRLE